jgi:hypothetical protein
MSCCSCHPTRREFISLAAAGTAAMGLAGAGNAWAGKTVPEWDPSQPLLTIGKPLTVQPVLMYTESEPKPQRSYKSWGGIQRDHHADKEIDRITAELNSIAKKAEFDINFKPVKKAKTPEQAAQIHQGDHDIVLVYAARGGGHLLRACFSPDRHTVVFVRHRSGPVYYWYEALSTRYLETDVINADSETNTHVHVDDAVVDDLDELLWRFRALYGVKNLLGTRIVALGGAWGKRSPDAPRLAQERFGMEIIDVSYEDLAKRISSAQNDPKWRKKAQTWTTQFLAMPHTRLETEKAFVENAFLLYAIFKDIMQEHDTQAFTIKDCMATVMPMSETTACLTLGLLNDEGLIAFCESDFVVIPPGILLRHISGKPIFMHNSTFPHNSIVTCAHCSAPRRMDGDRYEPMRVVTHYESEYGAAPKVEIPVSQQVSFLNPEYATRRWVGMKGEVVDNPFLEICRSQQDVRIHGDWKKLINKVRDSHWMMVYGDYIQECGYASRKLGMRWETV